MKNLLDVGKEIEEAIFYINENDEHITSIEINQRTLNHLKIKGIYGFSYTFNKEIPVIINDLLLDGQVMFHREKNNKITEYEPYEII